MTEETEAQLRRLVGAAAQQPGKLVTSHSVADRQLLGEQAARHQREADRLRQAAGGAGDE